MLTEAAFVNHTQNAVVRSGETLEYYIHNPQGDLFFDDASSGVSVGHSQEEADFIRSIFQTLDPLIDLDFNEVPDFTNSGLIFTALPLKPRGAKTLSAASIHKALAVALIGICIGRTPMAWRH